MGPGQHCLITQPHLLRDTFLITYTKVAPWSLSHHLNSFHSPRHSLGVFLVSLLSLLASAPHSWLNKGGHLEGLLHRSFPSTWHDACK